MPNDKKQQEAKTSNSISDFKKEIGQKYKDSVIANTLYSTIQFNIDFISDELWNFEHNPDHEVDINKKRDELLKLQTLVECFHDIFMKHHIELVFLLKVTAGLENIENGDPIPENISKKYPSLN